MGFFDSILEDKPTTVASSTSPTLSTSSDISPESLIILDTPTVQDVPNTAAELFSPSSSSEWVTPEADALMIFDAPTNEWAIVAATDTDTLLILDTPTEITEPMIVLDTPAVDMISEISPMALSIAPEIDTPVLEVTAPVIPVVSSVPDTDSTLRRAIEDLRKNDIAIEAQIQEALDAAAKCESERSRLEAERVRLADEAQSFMAKADETRASGKRTKDLITLITSQLTA